MVLKGLNSTVQNVKTTIISTNWTGRKLIAVIGPIIAVVLVLFLLNGRNSGREEAMTIRLQKYEEKVVAAGQLQLAKETTLVAEVSGEVLEIAAEEGDVVSAGSVIISINDSDRGFQLEQKKAGYENADAQYQHLIDFDYATAKEDLTSKSSKKDQEKKVYDAAVELYGQGAISQIDYLEYKADYEAALADWNSAKLKVASLEAGGSLRSSAYAQLQNAKASYEGELNDQKKYQIAAPWDTVLLNTYVNEHDYVRQGDQLADIGEAGSFHVVTELDEKYFPYLSKGLKAKIYAGDPGKTEGTEGMIDVISPKINSDTGTFEVMIGLPGEFPYLASDLTVNVEILLREKDLAVVIPDRYLIGKESSVYVYHKGKAQKVHIEYETGPSSNLLVTAGLREGDIIIKPNPSVRDGETVKISKGVEAS